MKKIMIVLGAVLCFQGMSAMEKIAQIADQELRDGSAHVGTAKVLRRTVESIQETTNDQHVQATKKRSSSFASTSEKRSRFESGHDESEQSTTAVAALHEMRYRNDIFQELRDRNSGNVLALLEQGAAVNVKNRSGDTPLHIAMRTATKNNMSVVEKLIETGADIAALNNKGEAIFEGALPEVADLFYELVDKRKQVSAPKSASISRASGKRKISVPDRLDTSFIKSSSPVTPQRSTDLRLRKAPQQISQQSEEDNESSNWEYVDSEEDSLEEELFRYITQGNSRKVFDLLEQGVPVTAKNRSGDTPLHVAMRNATKNDMTIVDELIKRGADVFDFNYKGRSVFEGARPEVAELISQLVGKQKQALEKQKAVQVAGVVSNPTEEVPEQSGDNSVATVADDNIVIEDDSTATAGEENIVIEKDDSTLQSKLFKDVHKDIYNGNTQKALAILKQGVPVNMKNRYGNTLLHAAARRATPTNMTVVKELIKRGADIRAVNKRGKTIFDKVHPEVERIIREYAKERDAAISVQNGSTPKAAISTGSDENTKNNSTKKRTPSGESTPEKRARMTNEQDEKEQSEKPVESPNGNSVAGVHGEFFKALRNRNTGTIIALLDQGAPVNSKNRYGNTPLHVAARNSNVAIVKELIERGADVTATNNKGETVFDAAPFLADLIRDLVKKREQGLLPHKSVSSQSLPSAGREVSPPHAAGTPTSRQTPTAVVPGGAPSSSDKPVVKANESDVDNSRSTMLSERRTIVIQEDDDSTDSSDVIIVPPTQKHSTPQACQAENNLDAPREAQLKQDLFDAARNGDVLAVQNLLRQGASHKWLSQYNETILYEAAQKNHSELVQWLLKNYPDLLDMLPFSGDTVCHMAARYGHLPMVKWLIENYPHFVQKVNNFRQSILVAAVAGKHIELAKYLAGAYPELVHCRYSTGYTILHVAVLNVDEPMIDWLQESYPELTTLVNDSGSTILHMAASRLNILHNLINRCKAQGCEQLIYVKDTNGDTVLHMAARDFPANKAAHVEIIEWITDHYPLLLSMKNNVQETPLEEAQRKGHFYSVQILRRAQEKHSQATPTPASVAQTSSIVLAPEHIGVQAPDIQVPAPSVEVISLQLGYIPYLNVNRRINGMTVLHCALLQGTAVIAQLLEIGADINTQDAEGRTVLMKAIAHKNEELTRLFLSHKANLDLQNSAGETALILAAKHGLLSIVTLLIEKGANTRIQDQSGRTFIAYLDPSISGLVSFLLAKIGQELVS